MKKILILCAALVVTCANCDAKDYAKLHIKEMQKSQKYASSKTYFTDYAPQTTITNNFEIKDPKLIKLGGYKEISDAQYKAKLAKDNIEYAKINNFLITRKVDNYNTQAYGEDFYKIYRITEKLIRANNLDFINWRIVIDTDKEFNATSSNTNCITINTGAFDTLSNNEDALAMLIGHELAHSLLGHAARKEELFKGIQKAERVNNYWYYLYHKKKLFRESKKMEFAADAEGAKLALKAGYDLSKGKELLDFINTTGNANDSYSFHPKPQERLKSFQENRKYFMDEEWIKQGRYNIYNSPVLECVKYIQENEGCWKGNMTQLLHKMNELLPELYIGRRLPYGFPTSASVLSRKLNTYKYDLDMLGLNVEIGRDTNRYVIIGKPENQKIAVDTGENDDIEDIINFD